VSERPAPKDDPLLGRVLDGGFEIVERMAQGGLSSVYRALTTGGAAAVKVLDTLYKGAPHLQRRFHREREILQILDGRAAPRPLGEGLVDGRPFLAMELCEGQLLSERIGSPWAPREAVEVVRLLLAALGEAHRLGVVHRDLKPSNVMLHEGTVQLLDFGAAVEADPDAQSGPVVFGTAAYSAPEQATDQLVDARADLYAVGVLLFELLTGRRPFLGDPIEVLRAHAATPPPSVRVLRSELSEALARVVRRALEKDRGLRFQDAASFSDALARTPEGGPA
jgi:serine/threonine-protein kinase